MPIVFDLRLHRLVIQGVADFPGAGRDLRFARPLIVVFDISGNFRNLARKGLGAFHRVYAVRPHRLARLVLVCHLRRGERCLADRLRQHFFLLLFEFGDAPLGSLDILAIVASMHVRQRRFGTPVVGIAAAIQIGLRQRFRLERFLGMLGIDQNHFKTGVGRPKSQRIRIDDAHH